MAPPAKFQIYEDEQQVATNNNHAAPVSRYFFEDFNIYPITGGEQSFEELRYKRWRKNQKIRIEAVKDIKNELDDMRKQFEALNHHNSMLVQERTALLDQIQQLQQIQAQQNQLQTANHQNRLSIVPQSLQPANCLEDTADMSVYGMVNEAPTAVQDLWRASINQSTAPMTDRFSIIPRANANTSFTVPIDQSQYIKDNVPTSTPAQKRRLSRPSMGGSPTLKLSPIEETSRECNSKSSSSSSGMSNTPGTVKKPLAPILEPVQIYEDRPLDPNDPTTYYNLLRLLKEPVHARNGYIRIDGDIPFMKPGETYIQTNGDHYLVAGVLSEQEGFYTANLVNNDSNESSNVPFKMLFMKVDRPANEWLFYICNELHRRVVKQKPDIELSIMTGNPTIFFNNGSILLDEFLRYVTLQRLFDACTSANKKFPRPVAAYLSLELLMVVRQMHVLDVVHMNIKPSNILITSCLGKDEVSQVSEQTSIIKLVSFDRAVDVRLLPSDTKFTSRIPDMMCCQMLDSKPWLYEIDWFGALRCIYEMLYQEEMEVFKDDRWKTIKNFKEGGFPTTCWFQLFDTLLNSDDPEQTLKAVDSAITALNDWIQANISFVIKESATIEMMLDRYKA